MRLVTTPAGLRASLASLLICVPMASIQVALAQRAPWWRLPVTDMLFAGGFAFGLWLIVAAFAMKTHRWTVPLATRFCGGWFVLSVGFAFWTRNPPLAFFSSLILLVSAIPALWLRRELGRSFVNPLLRWYQGHPKPLGTVKCTFTLEDQQRACRVSRLDTEGVFLYSERKADSEAGAGLRRGKAVGLDFEFRGKAFRCAGYPVSTLSGKSQGFGVGLQFRNLSPDQKKDLGDFIEVLRGEGYVQ